MPRRDIFFFFYLTVNSINYQNKTLGIKIQPWYQVLITKDTNAIESHVIF